MDRTLCEIFMGIEINVTDKNLERSNEESPTIKQSGCYYQYCVIVNTLCI